MSIEKLASVIESILFVVSESVSVKDLQKILQEDEEQPITSKSIKAALGELQRKYNLENSGLSLMQIEENYQIVSKIENNYYVEKVIIKKRKKSLSRAALEVVSIIAYKQPITKLEIDEIRGVKSDSVIGNLMELGLIVEKGRLDRIGRPILFGTTDKFLREFGIDKIKNLPEIRKVEQANE